MRLTGLHQPEPVRGNAGKCLLMGFHHPFRKFGKPDQRNKTLPGKLFPGGVHIRGVIDVKARLLVTNENTLLLPLFKQIQRISVAA